MVRSLLVPMVVALVAGCGSGVSWGHRDGIWGACYVNERSLCMDYMQPMDPSTVAQWKKGCTEDSGTWSDLTCPESQRGSCEITMAKTVIRYYLPKDLDKGKFACDYMGATWTEP